MKSQTAAHVNRLTQMYRESLRFYKVLDRHAVVSCADNGRTSAAHIGCIISAPTLIRDKVLRDQLMKHIPNAIGGEMEGWVLLKLKRTLKGQHNKHIEVMVIKGVADYGDLDK